MVKVKAKTSRKDLGKPTSCKEPVQCPHEHFRYEVPDRRGLARDKHINILATPKGYRWEDVKKESGEGGKPARKTAAPPRRTCSDRYVKKPEKAYVHNFLAEVWSFLTPEMADRLKNMLMNEFCMSSKDAEEFIFKQREANIVNSSTVSLYKKSRTIGNGKVVLDSVIKLRTPNKTYCDKFPKSNIGIRNSWIKDFSDLISDKMADYVLDTMTAERTERQQEIAQNLLNRFNTMLEQKASLAKPRTQTHKTMVLVADRLSLWLDKNVPMSKETTQRLKDIEEALERKKLEDERRKQIKEEPKRAGEMAGEEGSESEGAPGDEEQQGKGDQGGPPRAPEAQPGEPGAQPGEAGAQPGEPGAQPGEAGAPTGEPGAQAGEDRAPTGEPGTQPEEDGGAKPGEPRTETGEPGAEQEEPGAEPREPAAEPEEPGAEPGEPRAEAREPEPEPREPGAEPGEPGAEPGEPGTQPSEAGAQPAEPGVAPEAPEDAAGASEDDGTKPATGELPPAGAETQPEDGAATTSPELATGKREEEGEKFDEPQPGQAEETQPGTAGAVEELKGKEDVDQETPAPVAEDAHSAEPEQAPGRGEEEPQPDVPPPSETQPESADTVQPENLDGTQADAADQEKPLEEPKGEEAQDQGASSAPPPSGDEIQLTPSEIQEKADAEARAEEKAEGGPPDVALPGEADQKLTSGEEPPTEVSGEMPGGVAEQVRAPDERDKTAPSETAVMPREGEEKTPGEGDKTVGEPLGEGEVPASKEGQPAEQKVGEMGVGERQGPTTRSGEELTTRPGEEPTSAAGAKELTPEQQRQREVIQAVASKILETPAEETPRQEAIKDVLGKQLERELGDEDKAAIDQVASKVGTWIDKMVEQVETEYGDRDRRVPSSVPSEAGRRTSPVSQKPKGSIFLVKKVDDRRGYDVDLISNTRAVEKIRLARGKSPARAEVPNPDAALEPADLKNWAKWASAVSEMAQSWAEWIEDTVQEAQKRGEILQTDGSPERLREWDEFRGKKAQGAQQWRKTKKEVDETANLWSQKGMKTRELRKPQTPTE